MTLIGHIYSFIYILYKYDIPVGFPPGITSPRKDYAEGDNPQKDQNTKGGKNLDKYSSSTLLN